MNTGKTLFAQLMDLLPWSTFTRYVQRYGGDRGVRPLSCAEQFRAMAFAQLTYRESLRDIEVCLTAQVRISAIVDACFRLIVDGVSSRSWTIGARASEGVHRILVVYVGAIADRVVHAGDGCR